MALTVDMAWRIASFQCQKTFSLSSLASVTEALEYLTLTMRDNGFEGTAIILYCPNPKTERFILPIPGVSPKPNLAIVWLASGEYLTANADA